MKIFIDSRESGEVFSAFRRAAVDEALLNTLKEKSIEIVQENNMESGDFVCGEYAIEHKTPNDYRQSIINRHLADQTQMMKRNFKGCAIAYSGSPWELFKDNFGTGTFASFIVQDIPVLVCGNLDIMAVIVIKLLHKWNDSKVRDHNPNINQKVFHDVQLNIITGIEGIGEKNGNALLDHFGSIDKIVEATIEQLTEVDGIDKVRALVVYNALHGVRW